MTMITWYSAQGCTRPLTDIVFAVFIHISTFIVVVYSVYEKGIDKYVIVSFSVVVFKPWLTAHENHLDGGRFKKTSMPKFHFRPITLDKSREGY